jgi:hypothetical protein
MTIAEAYKLLATVSQNHNDWNIKNEDETKITPKKFGIIKLSK